MMFRSLITIAAVLVSTLPLHAELATGNGSCFYQGSRRISGALSISPTGVYAAIDLGLHDLISVGGTVGYNRHHYLSGWKYRNYPVLGTVALHPLNFTFLADLLLIRDRIDLYGGIAAGYVLVNSSWNAVSPTIGTPKKSGIRIGEYLGIRFFLNDQWHLFAEDCGAASGFALGLGRKL